MKRSGLYSRIVSVITDKGRGWRLVDKFHRFSYGIIVLEVVHSYRSGSFPCQWPSTFRVNVRLSVQQECHFLFCDRIR